MTKALPQKLLFYLLIWIASNFLALVLSYSRVSFFNSSGKPDTEKFWPFVKFTHSFTSSFAMYNGLDSRQTHFNGIFVDYDWSEFLIYTTFGVLVYAYFTIYKKQDNISYK